MNPNSSQTFPNSGRGIPQLTLQTSTAPVSTPDKDIWSFVSSHKNPQQNTRKPNSATYKKDYIPWLSEELKADFMFKYQLVLYTLSVE